MSTLFIGVPMGLKNRGEMNEVGVHDFASFDAPVDVCARGDLCPDGVSISGVDARGVVGIDISSVSGLSSITLTHCNQCSRTKLQKGRNGWNIAAAEMGFFSSLFVSSLPFCSYLLLILSRFYSTFVIFSRSVREYRRLRCTCNECGILHIYAVY